jgi:hypothetical protein
MTNGDRNVWQTAEWKSGWLMGMAFGVLICVVTAQLPNDAFERWTVPLAAAGVVTFVWGAMTYNSALKSQTPQEEQ